ncbi:hypothetical protein ONZ43_g2305 [Nemania bipapillata]|uniref:Uncharacterized protein n=1 Tax=Nemania bipapillata TaxID=110536 RepID=A0ACC2J141_9PEZI|nr:hypothetical protein ONZ43_g2305 [Nemania bipapillata]
MHIQEISDEVAERLKLEESQAQPEAETSEPATASTKPLQDDIPFIPATASMFPELSPGRAMTGGKTVDEVVAELKKSPFFMTELEENDETEAFKALAYEGTPLENASEFKEQGNECFKTRRWGDAKEFYTKGILILAAEERKRKKAADPSSAQPSTVKPKEKEAGGEGQKTEDVEKKEETSEDEVRQERATLESLYVNRAACHLELKNYRSCWLDGSAALRMNPKNIKAYYRSARAFLAP